MVKRLKDAQSLSEPARSLESTSGPGHGGKSPVIVVVSALFVMEGAIYSSVAPLLPHYRLELHMGPNGAGVLVATYTAGLIAGSVAAGLLSRRAGPRTTVLLGLGGMALASVAFGLATSVLALDAFRVAQGAAAGLLWGGGLGWLIGTSPPTARGTLVGRALGAAVGGSFLGPLVGALAAGTSSALAFGLVAASSAGLALAVFRFPGGHTAREAHSGLLPALMRTDVQIGAWTTFLVAIVIGAANTLVPLRMASLGATGLGVAATLLVAAAVAALSSPLFGRLVDRVGSRTVLYGAMAAGTIVLLGYAPTTSVALVGILTVALLGGVVSAWDIGGVAFLGEAARRYGVGDQVAAAAISGWFALGETIGAPGCATLVDEGSYWLPFVVLAAVALLTSCALRAGVGSTAA